MKRNDFKRLVAQELANGGVRFQIIYCGKEILLRWTNAQGFICNTELCRFSMVRPDIKVRLRYRQYSQWLKSEIL